MGCHRIGKGKPIKREVSQMFPAQFSIRLLPLTYKRLRVQMVVDNNFAELNDGGTGTTWQGWTSRRSGFPNFLAIEKKYCPSPQKRKLQVMKNLQYIPQDNRNSQVGIFIIGGIGPARSTAKRHPLMDPSFNATTGFDESIISNDQPPPLWMIPGTSPDCRKPNESHASGSLSIPG